MEILGQNHQRGIRALTQQLCDMPQLLPRTEAVSKHRDCTILVRERFFNALLPADDIAGFLCEEDVLTACPLLHRG